MYSGLSLDQAPPISVVMRFFLTMGFFGVAISALIASDVSALFGSNHLVLVHLFFLGIITMAMIGALFQMQSVLGGKPITSPLIKSTIVHASLTIGTIALGAGFYLFEPIYFKIATPFLAIALGVIVFSILPLLFQNRAHDTIRGMRLAIISLALLTLLGLHLAFGYASGSLGAMHNELRTLHYSIALGGWVGILIIAVAFQVVEMFYVTPPYSTWCKKNAFYVIFISLIAKIVATIASFTYLWIFDLAILALLIGFGVTTLKRLKNKKRHAPDSSIWFWMLAIAMLFISIALSIAAIFTQTDIFYTLALISFGSFALSIVLAMIGKIVPFLVWFHLNSAGYMNTPMMNTIITAKQSKVLFLLLVATITTMIAGAFMREILYITALTNAALFITLTYNIYNALMIYNHTIKTSERFTYTLE